MNWYHVANMALVDTPALLLYKERVAQNIAEAVAMVSDASLLRPHVKTVKLPEVCTMMIHAGIRRFKCATIAEAEMLALVGAPDVLLAYQPVGPKANRLLQLVLTYPQTKFGCLVDDLEAATHLSDLFINAGKTLSVYVDLNTGMNRSGIKPSKAFEFFLQLQNLPGLAVKGLHSYDGHLNHSDVKLQEQSCNEAFAQVALLADQIKATTAQPVSIVAGGSSTFPIHARRNVECSPGTFVFWDWGYQSKFPYLPFQYAALVATRVVSIVDEHTITTDLGHKAVAAENPLPRVLFLNAPDAVPVAQSEEHFVLQVADSSVYKTGDVLYAVPVHVCPTVALYERATVVENNAAVDEWKVMARDRKINA